MEAGAFHLVRRIISRSNPHIIRGGNVGGVGKAYGKRPLSFNVFRCSVRRTEAEDYAICIINAAPGSIHCVCFPVFVISTDNQYRERIHPCFLSKILSHHSISLSAFGAFTLSFFNMLLYGMGAAMSRLFFHLSVRAGSRSLFQNFSCPRFHFLLGSGNGAAPE